MGFWDKVKGWFGGEPPSEDQPSEQQPAETPLSAVEQAALRRVMASQMFVPMDLVNEVTGASRTVDDIRTALADVRQLGPSGRLAQWGYAQTGQVYHPIGANPQTYSPAPSAAPLAPPTTPFRAPAPPRREPTAPPRSAYEASEILGLSAEEMRERALKINPHRTPWIGRVDTIPPQSDERTALIDRGLILRGLLTEEQIREIHQVGDTWLRVHDAVQLATATAHKTADRALQVRREEKAAKKEQKKREALERNMARAAAVAKRRAEDIIHLGRGVSGKLGDRRANVELLLEQRLPVLASPQDVAVFLGLGISELRWLAYHAEAAEKTHYVYFEVPKRSGGTRLLSAPHAKLAAAQRRILQEIVGKVAVTDHAHGFVRGRSTVSNARLHVKKSLVINLDLKDFFPSISFFRIRGFFESLGYSPCAATILALLCTESPRMQIEHDGRTYWAAVSQRALPQGACTSPALSNLVARKLDRRLAGTSAKMGFVYTRYADDLTFSTDAAANVGLLLARVRHIVGEEGFAINAKKGKIQHSARRQEVTGIVVNESPGLAREEVRRLRAILHGAKKTGLAAQNREGRENFEAYLRGKIAYLSMIDEKKGNALRAELDALVAAVAE